MKYYLFTDGACQPNPGNGGWAFIVYPEDYIDKRIVLSGYEEGTTNNRMELLAIINGIKCVLNRSNPDSKNSIILSSDSKYAINGIKTWMHGWVKNNWRKNHDKELINVDLWKMIYSLTQKSELELECQYVKGHSGHPENEECDKLAVKEIAKHNDKSKT